MKTLSDCGYQSCLDAAYRYLSHRPRSEFEVKARLRKRGFDDSFIERAILGLRDKGFVNDTEFAQYWRDNRENFNPRGRMMLRSELRQKGIDPEIIAEVVGSIDEEESAHRAIQKRMKLLVYSDYESFYQRISAFLRRRGFGGNIVHNTVNHLWQESEQNNE